MIIVFVGRLSFSKENVDSKNLVISFVMKIIYPLYGDYAVDVSISCHLRHSWYRKTPTAMLSYVYEERNGQS